MKSGKSMLLIILGALLLLQGLLLPVEAEDTGVEAHNVLFLSSYSENFITTADELEGIRSVLDTYGINLDTEFMDSKRFPDPENSQNFYQSLSYKLEHGYAYDGVIVSDDAALQFAMDYQNDLFAGIPIYFIAINDYDRAMKAGQNPLMTGVYEKAALKDNIDLALEMIPQATQVVGIVDGTVTGIGDGKQFTDVQEVYPDLTFTLLWSSDYTFGDLADQLQRYDDGTIILFFTMSADKNASYLNMNQQFALVSENANVPVFRISVAGGIGTSESEVKYLGSV
ncbi:hypothetical protein Q5O14_15755 [Eubacteriaceae bacterium ES2]|nr:hypothetical protein Q5O14_15755 [Eubacteriaceae bacterium ES2]